MLERDLLHYLRALDLLRDLDLPRDLPRELDLREAVSSRLPVRTGRVFTNCRQIVPWGLLGVSQDLLVLLGGYAPTRVSTKHAKLWDDTGKSS